MVAHTVDLIAIDRPPFVSTMRVHAAARTDSEEHGQDTWVPDPTVYPRPMLAMNAPRATLGYITVIDPVGWLRGSSASKARLDEPRSQHRWQQGQPGW